MQKYSLHKVIHYPSSLFAQSSPEKGFDCSPEQQKTWTGFLSQPAAGSVYDSAKGKEERRSENPRSKRTHPDTWEPGQGLLNYQKTRGRKDKKSKGRLRSASQAPSGTT